MSKNAANVDPTFNFAIWANTKGNSLFESYSLVAGNKIFLIFKLNLMALRPLPIYWRPAEVLRMARRCGQWWLENYVSVIIVIGNQGLINRAQESHFLLRRIEVNSPVVYMIHIFWIWSFTPPRFLIHRIHYLVLVGSSFFVLAG